MERRLIAILAADVVGYSKLMGLDETGTLDALLRFRAELFEPEVAVGRGKVVKSMGDGWLVSFPSTAEAVACAFQMQDKLAAHDTLKLRIGIHIGDVVFEKDDIFGDGVNVAARLQEFSEPGAVALSDAAFGSLDGALAPSFDDVGWQDFKNIVRPIHVWQRAAPKPPETADGSGMGDRRPVLILRPVATSDDRAAILDLANALTGDIASCLASVGWLNSKTRTAAGEGDHVYQLTLNLRARGKRLRLELSLAAPDQHLLWSGKFDGDLDDAFEWQDETAQKVAIETVSQVLDRERFRLEAIAQEDMSAEECLIVSMMTFAILDEPSMTRNLAYLAAAIKKRPDYVDGYAHAILNFIACTTMQMDSALAPHLEAFPHWVSVASELDDPTPNLTIGLGLAAYRLKRDAPHLRRALKDVLRRAPFSVEIMTYSAWSYVWLGEPEPALACCRAGEKLMHFNPYAMPLLGASSAASVMAGNDDAAIAYALKGLETTDGYMALHAGLAAAYGHKGEGEAAARHLERLLELVPRFTISSRRISSGFADTPGNRRFEEGLRKAGLAE